ncbi:MAG: hypothetical protein U9P10_11320 [Thermodesulfobacteriota bacterium]|nr:hypothetical protein [Thermodesulfobacteriota bacterium]
MHSKLADVRSSEFAGLKIFTLGYQVFMEGLSAAPGGIQKI